MVALRAYALGSLEDGWTKVGPGTNEDDGPVTRCNGSHKGSCATEMGKSALEIYDSDTRARSVRVWDEVWIKQRAVVAKVCPRSEKSGEGQLAWCFWAM
jgi:hypothetical protein